MKYYIFYLIVIAIYLGSIAFGANYLGLEVVDMLTINP